MVTLGLIKYHRLVMFLLLSTQASAFSPHYQPFTKHSTASANDRRHHPGNGFARWFANSREDSSSLSMLNQFRTTELSSSSQRSLMNKEPHASLEAVAIPSSRDFDSSSSSENGSAFNQPFQQGTSFQNFWMPVLSSALLVTGNTFGAGSLVLPKLASGPGLGPAACVFVVAYALNLLSGLTLASVAITQYEESQKTSTTGEPQEIPSSFQEFVQTNLNSPELAMLMSGVSFTVNSLVLAFDISRVGLLFQGAGLDPMITNTLWSAALVALVSTQTQQRMSQVASLCVMALFASFGSLLLPGLASLTNPLADWFTPGAAAYDPNLFWHSMSDLTPVVVMCTIFQNIVPTVVKMLDYDRLKSYTAILSGSFLPLAMYIAWCWACLGQGGIDLEATLGGVGSNPLFAIFSMATLAGSSLGCSLSCAAEMDIFVKKQIGQFMDESPEDKQESSEHFQLASVLATVGLPLGLNAACANGGDLTSALHLAGGLGSPILYGIIPALMAFKQIKKQDGESKVFGKLGLGVLGAASTGMLCGNIAEFVTALIPGLLPTAAVAQAIPV